MLNGGVKFSLTNTASLPSGCLSGRCVSSSSWRFLSMATKTTFPPARRGPTWPRNWKNTPRPATTTAATTASTAATEREARQASPTTGETRPRRDTMVRKTLGWTHTTKMFWILNHQSHNNIMLVSFIIYLLPLCKSSSGDIFASIFGFLVEQNVSQRVAAVHRCCIYSMLKEE